jgi:hypothetical protein
MFLLHVNGSFISIVAIADEAAINDAILMNSFIEHLFFNVRSYKNLVQNQIVEFLNLVTVQTV